MKNAFDEFDDAKTPVSASDVVIEKTKNDEQKPLSASEVALGAVNNLIPSAGNYVKNLITPVIHPVDTINGMRDVAFGGLNKVIPGAGVDGQEQTYDAFIQALKNRYGGLENIKRTVATDPVGLLGDASMVFTGGGSALAKLPGVVGKTGSAVANVGRTLEPLNLPLKAGGMALKPVLDKAPMRLYESAIKPPSPNKTTRLEQQKILQEGLDAGITPNQYGIDKLESMIGDINGQIKSIIEGGAGQGKTVNVMDIEKRLGDVEELYKNMPNNKPYLKEIQTIRDGLLEKGNKWGDIPVDQAQKMKTTIYRVLKKSYGELSDATKEANKAVARGAKEEIAAIFPEINSLNNKESLLLRLEPMIEKASGRINKRDLMGIGTPIAGQAAANVVSPGAGKAVWLAKAVLDNPKAKAYLAIALNKTGKGKASTKFIDSRISSYFASKLTDAEQSQSRSLIPTTESLIPRPDNTNANTLIPQTNTNAFDEFDKEDEEKEY